MPGPEPFRIRIIDIILLTFALALLLGPWTEMERSRSVGERRRAAAILINAVLASSLISGAILARCSGHRRDEGWLTTALGALLVNQGIATAIPSLAVVLMPVGVVLAGALLFYVLGHLDV